MVGLSVSAAFRPCLLGKSCHRSFWLPSFSRSSLQVAKQVIAPLRHVTTSRTVKAMATEHPAITRFRDYLRINTVQPNPDYAGCSRFLEGQANELSLVFNVFECHPGKPIVLMTWRGRDPSLQSILLNSHTDVVPVFPEKWSVDPFEAVKRENGDILARGSQDMKCVGMSYLEAIRLLQAKHWQPLRTIHLSYVPDEEIGGAFGMKPFVKTDEFKALNVAIALDEGIASGASNPKLRVFYGERAPWWVYIKATGNTGHGSQFIKDTAVSKLLRVLKKFLDFRDEQEHLLEVGVHTNGKRYQLGEVTTTNLTILDSGVQFNVVPLEATAGLDIRVSPLQDLKEFQKTIDGWITSEPGVTWHFDEYHGDNSATSIDDSNVWWKILKENAAKSNIELEPEIFPAATDSRFLREIGVPAFGISYLRNHPILLHDHDEYVNENIYLEGLPFYAGLIQSLADNP